MTRRAENETPRCAHWIGTERRHCHTEDGVRPYLIGLRCPLHTPAAIAGKPEPQPGPGWPKNAWAAPLSTGSGAVIDQRAIASGKRRSSPQTYRAAQAAVHGTELTP